MEFPGNVDGNNTKEGEITVSNRLLISSVVNVPLVKKRKKKQILRENDQTNWRVRSWMVKDGHNGCQHAMMDREPVALGNKKQRMGSW